MSLKETNKEVIESMKITIQAIIIYRLKFSNERTHNQNRKSRDHLLNLKKKLCYLLTKI